MTPRERDDIYADILSAPERAARALERIDMDRLADKELKTLQRRVMLFVGAMQELAAEQRPAERLEVAD